MKKINLKKLDFKKTGIAELNNEQLVKIFGGVDITEDISNPRTITTNQSTRCTG